VNKYHLYEYAEAIRGSSIPGLYITTLYAYKDVLNLQNFLSERGVTVYWETREQTKGEKKLWKKK